PDTCHAGACTGGPPRDCDDDVPCTTDGCAPAEGCTHAPNHDSCGACEACSTTDGCVTGPRPIGASTSLTGCWESRAGTSKLRLKKASRDRRDRMTWRWGKGNVFWGPFGDPTTSTDYDVCMFGPDGDLVYRATAPAAASCGGRPCWK